MDEESALAQEAGPEVEPIVEEGQTEDQAAEPTPEGDDAEKKTAAASRRERDKANRARIVAERDAALEDAQKARDAKERILKAGEGKTEPTEAEFPDFADLLVAKTLWASRNERRSDEVQAVTQAEEAARKRAEDYDRQEQAITAQAWKAQVDEAKTRYADFEAVALNPDVPVSDAMARLIQTSDAGPDVAYFLGRNIAQAAEIAKLPPIEAARAIGRIEASLSLPKPRTATNAPQPISPVKGSGGAAKDPAKMSFAEFKAYREAGGKL